MDSSQYPMNLGTTVTLEHCLSEAGAHRLQVYAYYGSERNRSVAFLSQQDIVLTTYNVLSTELEAKNGIMKVRADTSLRSSTTPHSSTTSTCMW